MTSLIKSEIIISRILQLKSKDNTSQILNAKFYASWIKNKGVGGGDTPPQVQRVFKNPGKMGLNYGNLVAIPEF